MRFVGYKHSHPNGSQANQRIIGIIVTLFHQSGEKKHTDIYGIVYNNRALSILCHVVYAAMGLRVHDIGPRKGAIIISQSRSIIGAGSIYFFPPVTRGA